MKKGLSLFAITAILLTTVIVACNKEAANNNQKSAKNAQSYLRTYNGEEFNLTGQQYYRAIFYGDHVLADYSTITEHLYEYYQNLSDVNKTKSVIILDYIINQIESQNPEFFDDFATAIVSNDRSTIYEALYDAALIAYQYHLPSSISYFESYTVQELQNYISELPASSENSIIASSLGSETVIVTITATLLATWDPPPPTSTEMAIDTPPGVNLYTLADHLSLMNLDTP